MGQYENNFIKKIFGEQVPMLKLWEWIQTQKCLSCGHFLHDFSFYAHMDGMEMIDQDNNVISTKVWLYSVCQHCEYQNALWKLCAHYQTTYQVLPQPHYNWSIY